MFQLFLANEDEPLLIRRNALLILDLDFDVVDGVGSLNLESDCLASESFDEDLHVALDQIEYKN